MIRWELRQRFDTRAIISALKNGVAVVEGCTLVENLATRENQACSWWRVLVAGLIYADIHDSLGKNMFVNAVTKFSGYPFEQMAFGGGQIECWLR
jgi:hypothetical protein